MPWIRCFWRSWSADGRRRRSVAGFFSFFSSWKGGFLICEGKPTFFQPLLIAGLFHSSIYFYQILRSGQNVTLFAPFSSSRAVLNSICLFPPSVEDLSLLSRPHSSFFPITYKQFGLRCYKIPFCYFSFPALSLRPSNLVIPVESQSLGFLFFY